MGQFLKQSHSLGKFSDAILQCDGYSGENQNEGEGKCGDHCFFGVSSAMPFAKYL